jgi:FkbM family methyltransferase
MVLAVLFRKLKLDRISYLDIGAYDPVEASNTIYFYLRGSRGICVEPDPDRAQAFRKIRPEDTILTAGVSTTTASKATFYQFKIAQLSTFSKEQADHVQRVSGSAVKSTIEIPLLTFESIVRDHCKGVPDLVSLDAEGLDLAIVQSVDFSRLRPKVWCIETIDFDPNGRGRKCQEILDHMHANGYITYADTYGNTIFVDEKSWRG